MPLKVVQSEKSATELPRPASSIAVGSTFLGKFGPGAYSSYLLLKTYDAIVDLRKPSNTWSLGGGVNIYGYQEVDATLTYTVKA